MGTYIMLANWTEQGIKTVKESPARLDKARAAAKKLGCAISAFYMTAGKADMVIIVEAPDDATVARFNLANGMAGNIRTNTMKAFTEAEYRKIIGSL
jgi:uncharacterized protein with GYD domain